MLNNHVLTIRIISAAVLALSLLFIGCSKKKQESKKETRVAQVITGQATTRNVEYTLNQVGTLEASQEVTIRSEIDGPIVEILFRQGADVKKGEILARFDKAKIQAEIKNLEARINQLQIRLANRRRTLERKRPLVEQDLVSRLQFDELQTEIEEIEAEIVQAQANLTHQEERLSDTIIRAPFDGVIGARDISVGDYLKAGDPVVTVVDLDPLEISFQVPEKFKTKLFPGKAVLLTVDPYPDITFKGTISFISPKVDVNTRTFKVKSMVKNNRPMLNPGMFARVAVITDVHKNALTVPWESVVQTENETYIYVVEDGVARKIQVRLGKINSDWAEVLDTGISQGATVILEGKFSVKDGAKVAVR